MGGGALVSQTERIFFIDRTIREHRGIAVSTIASRFGICPRQAKRDIEYMWDRLNAPIAWSANRRRYDSKGTESKCGGRTPRGCTD